MRVLAPALLAFGLATWEFLSGTHAVDRAVLLGLPSPLQGYTVTSAFLNNLAHDLSSLGSVPAALIITSLMAGLLVLMRHVRAGVFLAMCVSSGAALAYALKSVAGALRPQQIDGALAHTSFPSGHAMLAALVYFALAVVAANLAPSARHRSVLVYCCTAAALLCVSIALSRVYLATHWPSDVVAGITAGIAWVAICNACYRKA